VESINNKDIRENTVFFPGFAIPDNMKATTDLGEVVEHAAVLLMVVPTPFVESTLSKYLRVSNSISYSIGPFTEKFNDSNKILVSCTKGILNESLETVDEILHRILPASFHSRLAYLSGPSFAKEVANKAPTVVTIASEVTPVMS